MRFRILKHRGDKFEVQRKSNWWHRWQTEGKSYPNIEAAKAVVRSYEPHMKPVVVS